MPTRLMGKSGMQELEQSQKPLLRCIAYSSIAQVCEGRRQLNWYAQVFYILDLDLVCSRYLNIPLHRACSPILVSLSLKCIWQALINSRRVLNVVTFHNQPACLGCLGFRELDGLPGGVSYPVLLCSGTDLLSFLLHMHNPVLNASLLT